MPVTTKVIDLADLRGQDEFPIYAVISSKQLPASEFPLSPTVMCWGETVSIHKVDDCRQFWLNQKKKQRCKLQQVFEPVLRFHYGDDFLAVFADHPWQGLLYLYYQQQRNATGLFFLSGRINQNVYKTLSWDCWFAAQQSLLEQLDLIHPKGFNLQSFVSRQGQFKRFIQRMGIASPEQMKQADAHSITRRFGRWMGRIWDWSFNQSQQLGYFPWLPQQPVNPLCVLRDLEYPVNIWAQIEVLLIEDFTRLCEQFNCSEGEHINRLDWHITLFNDQKINVELSFRHPYSLHRDQPDFKTICYQANYVYQNLMQELQNRDSDLDLPEAMPFIGWKLEISERITLPPQIWDFFADEMTTIDFHKVSALQNKLPLAFECYQLDYSFYVEQAFKPATIGKGIDSPLDENQWVNSAHNKPLFFYPQVVPINSPERAQKNFLERSSNQWWLSENALATIRDYYSIKDSKGRASWIYRDSYGNWFKQGEYS
jgi:hypothetical protein